MQAVSYFHLVPRDVKTMIMAYVLGACNQKIPFEKYIRMRMLYLRFRSCMWCLERQSFECPYESVCHTCALHYEQSSAMGICFICLRKTKRCAWCARKFYWSLLNVNLTFFVSQELSPSKLNLASRHLIHAGSVPTYAHSEYLSLHKHSRQNTHLKEADMHPGLWRI